MEPTTPTKKPFYCCCLPWLFQGHLSPPYANSNTLSACSPLPGSSAFVDLQCVISHLHWHRPELVLLFTLAVHHKRLSPRWQLKGKTRLTSVADAPSYPWKPPISTKKQSQGFPLKESVLTATWYDSNPLRCILNSTVAWTPSWSHLAHVMARNAAVHLILLCVI